MIRQVQVIRIRGFRMLFLASRHFFNGFFSSSIFSPTSYGISRVSFHAQRLVSHVVFVMDRARKRVGINSTLFSNRIFVSTTHYQNAF